MTNSQHDHAIGISPRKGQRAPVPRRQGFRPRLEGLEDRTVPSTLTVTNTLDSGAGSLRAAIQAAKSGDTILFGSSLNGQTITLTSGELAISKGLDIKGPGADKLAISGNHVSRVFDVSQNQKPVNVTIAGLTIENGRSPGVQGGGILNVSSTLTLINDVLTHNEALGNSASNPGFGGAIANLNGATLTATGCVFDGNQAVGSDGGGTAYGGAIDIIGSTVTLVGCTFTGNRAVGGNGGRITNGSAYQGNGLGGAIRDTEGSTLTVRDSTFTGNEALGGSGGNGGSGANGPYELDLGGGGAILGFNSALDISGSTFSSNRAVGGSHAIGGTSGTGRVGDGIGGALKVNGTAAETVTNCTFDHNLALGGSGNTGASGVLDVGVGRGGGIFVGYFPGTAFNASGLTVTDNQAVGGTGNTAGPLAGDGIGGGLAVGGGNSATISDSMIANNQAIGGLGAAGGNGGEGLGGGLASFLGASLTVRNSYVTGNQAIGGAGGSGANGGNGFGGGAYNDGRSMLTILVSTITDNQAIGGAAGVGGIAGLGEGGGLYLADDGVACLDAFTQANTKKNKATSDHNDIFGSFTTC